MKAIELLKFLESALQVTVRVQITEGATSAGHDSEKGRGNIVLHKEIFSDALEELERSR